ncbi:MAG: hypothetical protein L3J28_06330 [Candidatus Polarisedimenticolaceae bacterium]|nr:hypothetical protein [Candidatus Polarisedimenticolaceae bacterium]
MLQEKWVQIWPTDYTEIDLLPETTRAKLKNSPAPVTSIAVVPLIEQFAAYTYLWPSPMETEDNDEPLNNRPLEQPYLLGCQVLYRQEWHLLGHARGELLHSLPLAPGEETTIEVLTWDRNVYRRDAEINTDLERNVEENHSFKDSREVAREMQKTKNWYVSGKGSVNIFNMVKVNADPGGMSEQTVHIDKNSRQTITEATQSTGTRLHNQRKTSISTTREYGREDRISRKLTNTNRCHPVSYHFHEVVRNYRVKTALATPAARPCIFVKQEHPIERSELLVEPFEYDAFLNTLRWIHTNSHILARGLLDRSFFNGLTVLPEVLAYWSLRRGLAATGPRDVELRSYVSSLVSGTQSVYDAPNSLTPGPNFERSLLKLYIAQHASWLFSAILLDNNSLANMLESHEEGALTQAVDDFLSIYARDYPNTPQAFRSLFESDWAKRYIANRITSLRAAYAKLVYGPAPGEEPEEQHLNRMREVSEVVRLLRHIEQNHLHYFQLIWAAKDPGQLILETSNQVLPGGNDVTLADVIEPTPLGFYADYAVFPYTRAEEGSALALLIESFLALQNNPPKEVDVVLPTNGIVVEAELGDSNACEPFIQQHRQYDLQIKEKESEQAELENQRRRRKIERCQLDNPECCPPERYGLLHRFLCWLCGRRE